MSTQQHDTDTEAPLETRATGSYDERDGLTGVRGRYTLLNDYASLKGREVFIVLADVDNFRSVNDAYGDNVGNDLLREIGRAIVERFGDEHTFRYGSDEFIIVDEASDEAAFTSRLDCLARDIASIGHHRGRPLNLTCSYGYVHGLIASSADLHEAIRFADRKMYEAKRLGKARAVGVSLGGDSFLRGGMHSHPKMYRSYEIDELTGLVNLVFFRSRLSDLIASRDVPAEERHPGVPNAPAPDDPLAVVFFNIENFKSYNGRFGFAAGDELLMLVADAIGDAFPGCLASRTQSDQFMVATLRSQVLSGIQQVRGAFRSRMKDSSIWLKAGFYVPAPEVTSVDAICDRAKLACDAIRGRRDVFYLEYDHDLERQLERRHHILDHFDEALERGHIKAYYQPIIRVATGEVCDEEALARWEDPEIGLIMPDDFISVLEEARIIHRLDLYIVRRCCENLRRVLTRGTVRDVPSVSVNLSRLDFELCDIVGEIEGILASYQLPRSYLSIEVTESALIGNSAFLKGEIDRFRAAGFEVWMDDFGSGYSSINLLKEYKFDLVKLDMGFLQGFDESDDARILLTNVIKMLKELGLRTLVEGVETEEQLQFLKSIGCGRAQGYLVSRPQSLDAVIQRLEQGIYLPIEPLSERDFYERLGGVNLTRPLRVGLIDGHYVASDRAAAILLRQEGRYEYLNITDVYREHLHTIGIKDTAESSSYLMDPGNSVRRCLDEAIDAALASGQWERFSFVCAGIEVKAQMCCVAKHAETDSVGVLIVVRSERSVTDPAYQSRGAGPPGGEAGRPLGTT